MFAADGDPDLRAVLRACGRHPHRLGERGLDHDCVVLVDPMDLCRTRKCIMALTDGVRLSTLFASAPVNATTGFGVVARSWSGLC